MLLVVGLIFGGGCAYYFMSSTYQFRIDVFEQEIVDLCAQISNLLTENSNLQRELVSLSSELGDAESEISVLEAQVSQLDLDLGEAEVLIDGHESEVSSYISQVSNLQFQVSLKDEGLTSLQSDCDELESELECIKEIMVTQHYTWYFDYDEYSWDFPITLEAYLEYYFKDRSDDWADWTEMVADPGDDAYIGEIVEGLNSMAIEYGFKEIDKVNFVISFVQNLPYTEDVVTTGWDEYPRYPIETLFDRGGDCEDTSILVATILDEMGYDVCLLILEDEDHCAVGIDIPKVYGSYYELDGNQYYYLETTGDDWTIGQIPPDFEDTRAYIYPIGP